MVVPLLTRLLAPSPRDECEFDREVPPDLLPFERPRRDELELAEDGREIWEGGARVAPDEVVWVALGLEDGSGDDMSCAESDECAGEVDKTSLRMSADVWNDGVYTVAKEGKA